MKDAMHKASRKVIELAIENKCKAIVLGDLKDIKQESAIKSFVQVPVMKLIDQIRYKAELEGIKVVQTKETYTSGVSAYDMEAVTKANYNKKRRVKRGLFKTEKGYEVNSDINGSLNILRKYMVEEELTNVVPIQVKELRDNGCMDHPVRLQVV
jgi:IS605 OrfB family transposase